MTVTGELRLPSIDRLFQSTNRQSEFSINIQVKIIYTRFHKNRIINEDFNILEGRGVRLPFEFFFHFVLTIN